MHVRALVAALALGLALAHATSLTIYNLCDDSVDLYDNSATETIASGGSTTRTMAEGFSGIFRDGASPQATLAEFSITGGFVWYDISIVPTGTTGPGDCSSLPNCKAVTGGTGFNTPMQIAPDSCATVTCLEDGCADAYQSPRDSGKTHACMHTAAISLTFCPAEVGSAAGSTAVLTEAPSWTEPPSLVTSTPVTSGVPSLSLGSTSKGVESSPTLRGSAENEAYFTTAAPTADVTSPSLSASSAPAPVTSSTEEEDGSSETVSTESESSSPPTAAYVASIVGGAAVVGAIVLVAMVIRKRQHVRLSEECKGPIWVQRLSQWPSWQMTAVSEESLCMDDDGVSPYWRTPAHQYRENAK